MEHCHLEVVVQNKFSERYWYTSSARNAINARNVTKDPGKNYYAAEEFLNKFTTAYLVAGALAFFGMDDKDSSPTINSIEQKSLESIHETIHKFIEDFTDLAVPEVSEISPITLRLVCQVCGKRYNKGTGVLRKHEKECHGFPNQSHDTKVAPKSHPKDHDFVLNYTKCALNLLLLRLNMNDAIKMGDGSHIYRNMELMYLYFKVTGCFKYAFGCLETLAQVKCLLTPCLAYRLKWNRVVNAEGKINSNYPKDLDLEHSNKLIKQDLKTYRGEITEKTSRRISRSTDTTTKMAKNIDKVTGLRRPSGKHKKSSANDDVAILTEQFHKAKLFDNIRGYSVHLQLCLNDIFISKIRCLK